VTVEQRAAYRVAGIRKPICHIAHVGWDATKTMNQKKAETTAFVKHICNLDTALLSVVHLANSEAQTAES
jgi:hypothetical protein